MTLRKTKIVTAVLIVLLVVLVGSIWYFTFYSAKPTSDNVIESATQSQAETQNIFESLKGEAFDEAYIADMIAHHEGAISMAEQAQAAASHAEIKTLASAITQTQSAEIEKMRKWQQDWGYEITSGVHGGHSMTGDMDEMQAMLSDLAGEAFDNEFLTQMIVHHKQAIEMSEFAETNAGHQEIKDLAKAIIAAQTQEIVQMEQWRAEWGY
jgi:uncharacterized protein (DUF305 family)